MSEPDGFVIRALPVNVQKGRQVELILQTKTGPAFVRREIPHIATAGGKSIEEAERLKDKLSCEPFNKMNLQFRVLPYAQTGHQVVLQIFGGRDDIREVVRRFPSQFTTVSAKQWLNWYTNFPFSEFSGGRFSGSRASSEEVLFYGSGALDIEKNKIVQREDELKDPDLEYEANNTATFSSKVNGAVNASIVSTLDSGKTVLKLDGLTIPVHLVHEGHVASTLDDIMRAERKEKNLLFLRTFNGMTFDLIQLRDTDSEEFLPTQDGQAPKITAHVKDFSRRVEIKDMFVVDYYRFAAKYMPYLPSKRFEVVCKFLSTPFKKDIGSYTDMDMIIFAAQHGDKNAAAQLHTYNVRDTTTLHKIGEDIDPVIEKISRSFEVSPEAVCATSDKTNAFAQWSKRQFMETNALSRSHITQAFKKFDCLEEKLKLFQSKHSDEIKLGLRRGTFYVVYLNTLNSAFDFARDELLAEAVKVSTGWKKISYLLALDSLCEKPLFDLQRAKDYAFEASHKETKKDVSAKLEEINKKARQFLQSNGLKVANYSRHVVVLEGPAGLESAIEASSSFALLGISQTLFSLDREVFLAQINGCFVGYGIDVTGRRGKSTAVERETIACILENVVKIGNYFGSLNYIYEKLAMPLANGTIDRNLLLFRKKIRRDISEYTLTAQGREDIDAQRDLEPEVGKTMAWGYAIKDGKPVVVSAEEFLRSETVIDTTKYAQHFFSQGAKLGHILSSLYNPYAEKNRKSALRHILQGKPASDDWQLLKRNPEKLAMSSKLEQFT